MRWILRLLGFVVVRKSTAQYLAVLVGHNVWGNQERRGQAIADLDRACGRGWTEWRPGTLACFALLLVLSGCGGVIDGERGRPEPDAGLEVAIGPGCFASDAACPSDPGYVCQAQGGYCCCEAP